MAERMKIFISWSGTLSNKIAQALTDWLKDVFPDVQVWMSSRDMPLGVVWTARLMQELADSDFGIICLTSDNLDAPWLMFEAGAIAKTLGNSRAIPLLYDVEPEQLEGPLEYFQAARMNKQGVLRLVEEINSALPRNARDHDRLERTFETWWPQLHESLQSEFQRLMEDYPQSVYRYLAERFGVGHRNVTFECEINADGTGTVRRTIQVEAFSQISSLGSFLLFPEATSAEDGKSLTVLAVQSRDPEYEITYRPVQEDPSRLSIDLTFKPALENGARVTYTMTEATLEPVFPMRREEGAGDEENRGYFGWTVYRPTRNLTVRVVLPHAFRVERKWLDIQRASTYGLPVEHIEQREWRNLAQLGDELLEDGRRALTLHAEYPVHGFVYLLNWLPAA